MRPRGPLFLLILSVSALHAQDHAVSPSLQPLDTSVRRFEIGGQLADIRTGCIGQDNCHLPSVGLGLGATLNLNQHFALDANANVTPGSSNGATQFSGGRASELLLGIRAEVRAKRYGYFLKAQPGVMTWSRALDDILIPTPTTFTVVYGTRHRFVSDVGAGLEYSPSSRVHVRAEVSDLVMYFGGSTWVHNLQPSAGLYVGLGKPVFWKPPVYVAKGTHPFFNTTNVVLIAGSVLGTTADAITTQRFISRGQREGDPFARPLVKYGWSGQVGLMTLEIAAETLAMYGLHRIGQHWIERLTPVCIAATHGVFAYKNTVYLKQKP